MSRFYFYKQLNAMDCGPTCLRMVAKSYGRHFNADTIRQMSGFNKAGVTLLGISDTAEKIGFRTRGASITFQQLNTVPYPAILHWNQQHFVVLVDVGRYTVKIADPDKGMLTYTHAEFLKKWIASKDVAGNDTGIALLLEPTPAFYLQTGEKEQKLSWSIILQYLKPAKWEIVQIFAALLFVSLIQLVFPLLTQSIVDTGVNTQNLQFIIIVLIAQLMLTFSQTIVTFIRSRLQLRVSNMLNLQILSDFWLKLTRLPVSYFDLHHTGDTLQRISDHKQIQDFLTGTALTTLFSVFSFIIYAVVLSMYHVQLLFIFSIGSILYFLWVHLFQRIRRKINYETFYLSSKENNNTLQLIQGMQEIRLNNAEKQKRWEWENIQTNIFTLNLKSLNYSQIQAVGGTFINQVQGIAISFVVARLVVDGRLTFGAMLAVQYIIGQLSGPVQQWVTFVQGLQGAKISMERLNEIHQLNDEEDSNRQYIQQIPDNHNIQLKNLSFSYPGTAAVPVLQHIHLLIPQHKVTAIVGASGSGKTTLIKILLKVYDQYQGEIRVGAEQPVKDGMHFGSIHHQYWRSVCGAVLQDGFIFNDNIARNIAVGEDHIDFQRLVQSCRIANIQAFIESLPNTYYTQLGVEGAGLSQGQKQRILIARAVYKNPAYLFFDEATNALDAKNEKDIVENLEQFFEGRTVVVVAHRLSTVRNADKIVVLDRGRIVEEGTHEQLSASRGRYYELVKNQLELGS